MRRLVALSLLTAGLAWAGAPRAQEGATPRFAEVSLRILTMGERQPVTEVGTFVSSLPLGKPGGLRRALTITNETRSTRVTLGLSLTVTPSLDDQGVLHCVILTQTIPAGGASIPRAKDMAFAHPGEQVMELYADGGTSTRVALAVSAALADPKASESPKIFPPITFLVRVEQWNGAQRTELENLQLQSLDGVAVTHDYQRKVPRWVDGAAPAEGGEQISLESLPVLDLTKSTPTLQAGQGFSIPLSPKEQEKQRKEAQKEAQRTGMTDPAQVNGTKRQDDAPARKIVWDQESYHLSIEPLVLHGGELSIRLAMRGQILDPANKLPAAPVDVSAEKSLQAGQPTPFYLTREVAGGPQGYLVWVVPQWSVIPPPGEGGDPTAAPAPPAPAAP